MGKFSRDKGARFEREVASMFKQAGYDDAHRTAQHCGKTGQAGDVEGVPKLHIEAKHNERLNLFDAMEQAVRDATANGEGKIPCVIHTKNRKPTLITFRLADAGGEILEHEFLDIYREFEAGLFRG